jgi:hypothetical protein
VQEVFVDVLAEPIDEYPFLLLVKAHAEYLGRKLLEDTTVEKWCLMNVGLAPEHQDKSCILVADATQLRKRKSHVDAVLNDREKTVLSELAIGTDLGAGHNKWLPAENFDAGPKVVVVVEDVDVGRRSQHEVD